MLTIIHSAIAAWKKATNWATIFTYTTNATHATVTNWVGEGISTSPIIPDKIEHKKTIITPATTFNAKTALTNCYIRDNVSFVDNSMVNAFKDCTNLIEVDKIPANVTDMASTFS